MELRMSGRFGSTELALMFIVGLDELLVYILIFLLVGAHLLNLTRLVG
jgi:hypothetical protein